MQAREPAELAPNPGRARPEGSELSGRRALVLGGRGQCGRAILQRLAAEGWELTATASGPLPQPAPEPEVRWLDFDRDREGDLGQLLPQGVEVVVDTTAMGPRHARQLLRLGDRIGGAVVLSTVSVYRDAQGRSLEGDEAPDWPGPIPEDCALVAPGEDSYPGRKSALEAVLREEAPWPVTIIRPGAIHGPFSRHLREWYFIKRVLDGRARVVLPFGGESVLHPTATVNLAALVSLAVAHPGSRVLNCGDLEPPSVSRISAVVDGIMGWATERVTLPGPPPSDGVGDHPWATPHPLVVDMTRAETELGYREQATYADALRPTVGWALEACSGRDWRQVFPILAGYPGDLFDYASEDAYLAASRAAGC